MNSGVQLLPCYDLIENLTAVLSNNPTMVDENRLGKIIDKLYKLKLKILEHKENVSSEANSPIVQPVSKFPALADALSLYSPGIDRRKVPENLEQKPANLQAVPAGSANKILIQPIKKDKQLERIKQCLLQLKTLLTKNTVQEFKGPLSLCKDMHSILMNELRNRKCDKKLMDDCAEKSKIFAKLARMFHESENKSDLLKFMGDVKLAAFNLISAIHKCIPECKDKYPCIVVSKFRLKQCIEKLEKLDKLCMDGNLGTLKAALIECKDIPSLINGTLNTATAQNVASPKDLEETREKSREVAKLFHKFNETTNMVEIEKLIKRIMIAIPLLVTKIQMFA